MTTITKRITWNDTTRVYECYLTINGTEALVGLAETYSAAETLCRQVYEARIHPVAEGFEVRVERYESEPDDVDDSILGTQYLCGTGDSQVEVWIPDKQVGYNTIQVYMLGCDGFTLEDIARVLPALNVLMSDARVKRLMEDR